MSTEIRDDPLCNNCQHPKRGHDPKSGLCMYTPTCDCGQFVMPKLQGSTRLEDLADVVIRSQGEEEAIHHPAHYGGDTPYEAIKVIMAWGLGFCLGNAVKYIARAGRKDPSKKIEDLKKARWFLDYEIQQLEEEDVG